MFIPLPNTLLTLSTLLLTTHALTTSTHLSRSDKQVAQAYYACCNYDGGAIPSGSWSWVPTSYTYVINLPGFGNNDTNDPINCIDSNSCGQVAKNAINEACDNVLADSRDQVGFIGKPSFLKYHDTYVTFSLSAKLQVKTSKSGYKMPKCIEGALNRAAQQDLGREADKISFECKTPNKNKPNGKDYCQDVVDGNS
ncbi:hypothetical protein BCON_0035g00470 [Botryotinia convoluta]|uniref:Ecp2 effector protein domain-containing protein n=1 Tax=Botryotinia convoluta TaxID=54673 RepID=A0A4Z1IFX5_9HELO|nr:hypothetical protein BCON_0035g00470 [Botryotinia convoluta]